MSDRRRPMPREPKTWEDIGLDPLVIEHMILRLLMVQPRLATRLIAQEVAIAANLIKDLTEEMRQRKILTHTGTSAMGDTIYDLTEQGRVAALDSRKITAYMGPAPVRWDHYLKAVRGQSLSRRPPSAEDLERAFGDLTITKAMLRRIGPAVVSGRAMFLFGEPGNGKTSIAERITRAFGDAIWIPHAVYIDGQIVKLYDPATHEAIPVEAGPEEKVDGRWVQVKRPTVVAGGELTLEMLELQPDPFTNVSEPPLQLKANCGTLVIDDFGRGRVPPKELLNRWIFPLEKRIDFLRLPDGRKIQVPFECLLVFSTNLDPSDLTDEAFLRRIPYKIEVLDPSEDQFKALVGTVANAMNVKLADGSLDYLVNQHYRSKNRKFRFCHPRDLLSQVSSLCSFERRPAIAGPEEWDEAVSNYFGAG